MNNENDLLNLISAGPRDEPHWEYPVIAGEVANPPLVSALYVGDQTTPQPLSAFLQDSDFLVAGSKVEALADGYYVTTEGEPVRYFEEPFEAWVVPEAGRSRIIKLPTKYYKGQAYGVLRLLLVRSGGGQKTERMIKGWFFIMNPTGEKYPVVRVAGHGANDAILDITKLSRTDEGEYLLTLDADWKVPETSAELTMNAIRWDDSDIGTGLHWAFHDDHGYPGLRPGVKRTVVVRNDLEKFVGSPIVFAYQTREPYDNNPPFMSRIRPMIIARG